MKYLNLFLSRTQDAPHGTPAGPQTDAPETSGDLPPSTGETGKTPCMHPNEGDSTTSDGGPKISEDLPPGAGETGKTPCMHPNQGAKISGDLPEGAGETGKTPCMHPNGEAKIPEDLPEGTGETGKTPCMHRAEGGFAGFAGTREEVHENSRPPDGEPRISGYPPEGTDKTGETPCTQSGEGGFVSFVGTPDRELADSTSPAQPVPWSELQHQRWGPGLDDPTPGIVIPPGYVRRPYDPVAEQAARDDPYAVAEREAIQAEAAYEGLEAEQCGQDWLRIRPGETEAGPRERWEEQLRLYHEAGGGLRLAGYLVSLAEDDYRRAVRRMSAPPSSDAADPQDASRRRRARLRRRREAIGKRKLARFAMDLAREHVEWRRGQLDRLAIVMRMTPPEMDSPRAEPWEAVR